jgi:hypothetical protein
MVLSIFESQRAKAADEAKRLGTPGAPAGAVSTEMIDMPDTITELYRVAANAMLDRLSAKERGGGDAVGHLKSLLGAIFFRSHAAERRIIREPDLETAVLGLANPNVLRAIEERTAAGAERAAAVHEAAARLPRAKLEAISDICERVRSDRLPLLSLISALPIEMQSSHLSFQVLAAADPMV